MNDNTSIHDLEAEMIMASTLTDAEMEIINDIVANLLPTLCDFDHLVETIREKGVDITDEQLFELSETNEDISMFIDIRGF